MGRKGRSPKVLRQEKAKGLLARSDELEADYAELVELIPEVQTILDDTSAPTSLKQGKVNQLSNLVGKICTFSALLTPRQANKLQIVQGQIRRFKQSIKRGILDNPSHTACVDLSTSLNEVGTEVEYSPDIRRPAPQPAPQEVAQEEAPANQDDGPSSQVPSATPVSSASDGEAPAGDLVSSAPSVSCTGTRPKDTLVAPATTAVVLRQDYPVVSVSEHCAVVSVGEHHTVVPTTSSTQVRSSDYDYSVNLDPGDPINAPPVSTLQPVLNSDSALLGFTSPERNTSFSQELPDKVANPHVGRGSQRGRKSGFNNVPKFNQPPPIRSVAFSIYRDPSCRNTSSSSYYEPPNTIPHTVYDRPIVYPYRCFPQSGRVPLAPLDQPWSKHLSSEGRHADNS